MSPKLIYGKDMDKRTVSFMLKRNKRIYEFFRYLEMPVRLIGNAANPAIINGSQALSVHMHKWDMIFRDQAREGKEIYRENIHPDRPLEEIDKATIFDWIGRGKHTAIKKITIVIDNNIQLFLGEYSIKRVEPEFRQDIDSVPADENIECSWTENKHRSAIFFTQENAEYIGNLIKQHGYSIFYE